MYDVGDKIHSENKNYPEEITEVSGKFYRLKFSPDGNGKYFEYLDRITDIKRDSYPLP